MKLISHGLTFTFRQILPSCIASRRNFKFQAFNNNPLLPTDQTITFGNVRHIQTSKQQQRPKTPDLIYVPHVLRWLKTKFRFKYLQKTWDPDFSEGAFIYGTTQALCRITEIIHADKPERLQGLLTDSGIIKLQDDMSSKITKLQKKIIELKPGDIKILVPLAVNLRNEGFTKKCDVSLRSLALKWFQDAGSLKLVLVALQTEFVRDYSRGNNSEWTISIFDILECAMLSESPAPH